MEKGSFERGGKVKKIYDWIKLTSINRIYSIHIQDFEKCPDKNTTKL